MGAELPPPSYEPGDSPVPRLDQCPLTTYVYDARHSLVSVDRGDGRGPMAPAPPRWGRADRGVMHHTWSYDPPTEPK